MPSSNLPWPEPPPDIEFEEVEVLQSDKTEYHYADLSLNNVQMPKKLKDLEESLGTIIEVNEKQKKAVQTYSSGTTHNGSFRNDVSKSIPYLDHIHTFDDLFSKSKLQKNISVYRSLGGAASKLTNLKIGDIFSDEGYMSTSLNPDISIGSFSSSDASKSLMMIDLPMGSEVIYIDSIRSPGRNWQWEIVLPRNQRFIVVDIFYQTRTNTRWTVFHMKPANGKPLVSVRPPSNEELDTISQNIVL